MSLLDIIWLYMIPIVLVWILKLIELIKEVKNESYRF